MEWQDDMPRTAADIGNDQRARAARQGLYCPAKERDACGVGFVADLSGTPSHRVIEDGLKVLINLTHRGATGADPKAGDGAGALVQIPHAFMKREAANSGLSLPEPGHYAVGHIFMPQDEALRQHCEEIVEEAVRAEGQVVLGWRDVEVDNSELSQSVIDTEPVHRQIFVGRGRGRRRRHHLRAPALSLAQGDLEHGLSRDRRPRQWLLHRLPVMQDDRLQRHVPGQPARALLQRPDGSRFRLRPGAGASAFFHQHLSLLEAGASLPHGGP